MSEQFHGMMTPLEVLESPDISFSPGTLAMAQAARKIVCMFPEKSWQLNEQMPTSLAMEGVNVPPEQVVDPRKALVQDPDSARLVSGLA